MRLFWRNDDGRWRWGEIGPLAPGDHQVEMIAMGPQGETTPAPIRCSILVRGQAAWVVPRIAGHEMEDDAPMEQARKSFGYYGVPILEDAVRHSPHNVYYWAALVDALSNEERASFPFNDHAGRFAERASREALKLNPGDPLLLVARARLFEPSAAIDVLDELERVPGHAHEAKALQEILRLGLLFPELREDLMIPERAIKLIGFGRIDRALEVVDEGLSSTAKDCKLLALRAMVLALQGKFDEAMEVQKACGYCQLEIDSYSGLGDCLLKQGKPDLALRSFGDRQPQSANAAKVLAWACAETKDFARAEALLQDDAPWRKALAGTMAAQWGETPSAHDEMLLLRVMLAAGDKARADEIGAKIVEPLVFTPGSHITPYYNGPASLAAEYERAVHWLQNEFPEKKGEIVFYLRYLGARFEDGWPPSMRPHEVMPASQRIAGLRARLEKTADAAAARDTRDELAQACADAQQYAEAAKVIAKNAVEPWTNGAAPETMNPDAVRWSIWKRRAAAEALYQQDSQRLAAVRPLIREINDAIVSARTRPQPRNLKTRWRPSVPACSPRSSTSSRVLDLRPAMPA